MKFDLNDVNYYSRKPSFTLKIVQNPFLQTRWCQRLACETLEFPVYYLLIIKRRVKVM